MFEHAALYWKPKATSEAEPETISDSSLCDHIDLVATMHAHVQHRLWNIYYTRNGTAIYGGVGFAYLQKVLD